MNIISKARVFLIKIGKSLPFFLCFFVLISYAEDLFAMATNSVMEYEDCYILYKPLSWYIGDFVEYNIPMLVVITIISIAIETCYWNKLAILYLLIQLGEKEYFSTVELYEETICIIAAINILVCGFFVWRGIDILRKQ